MHDHRMAALAMGAATLLAVGCGASKSTRTTGSTANARSSSVSTVSTVPITPTPPLSRAQLIARADLICGRLNAKRATILISSPEAYARLIPALAAYQLAVVAQMQALTPPASMERNWKRIVADNRTMAEATGYYPHYSEVSNLAIARHEDAILSKATSDMLSLTKREGFKDCSKG